MATSPPPPVVFIPKIYIYKFDIYNRYFTREKTRPYNIFFKKKTLLRSTTSSEICPKKIGSLNKTLIDLTLFMFTSDRQSPNRPLTKRFPKRVFDTCVGWEEVDVEILSRPDNTSVQNNTIIICQYTFISSKQLIVIN